MSTFGQNLQGPSCVDFALLTCAEENVDPPGPRPLPAAPRLEGGTLVWGDGFGGLAIFSTVLLLVGLLDKMRLLQVSILSIITHTNTFRNPKHFLEVPTMLTLKQSLLF